MADLGIPQAKADGPSARSLPDWLTNSLGTVAALLAFMWLVEIVDTALLSDSLQRNGIQPRSVEGLDGIFWSPFLHGGFRHLISNSIPFVVLSGLTLTGGMARYVRASAIIIGLGGLLVWGFAIGSNENHIGASGWIFGLLGFLIAAALIERKALSIVVGLVALFVYGGTLLVGFVPAAGISWEGHLFGFIAGVVAARVIAGKRLAPSTDSSI